MLHSRYVGKATSADMEKRRLKSVTTSYTIHLQTSQPWLSTQIKNPVMFAIQEKNQETGCSVDKMECTGLDLRL